MDWNFVKVYLAIYRENTVADAAEALEMSVSTLFRHLNSYEESIGKLFLRQSGRYTLTDLGEEILELALNIDESFNDIDRRVFARDELGSASVKVTAPTSFSYGYFPEIIEKLKEAHPQIDIDLLVTNDTLCLNARQADIALRVTTSPPDNFIGKKVREIKWGVYGGYGYLSKFGHPTSIEELKNHRVIGGSGRLSKSEVFSWVSRNFSDNTVLSTDDLVAMFYLAEKNHGIAILPDEFNQGNIKRLFTIDEIGTNSLWVLTHSDLRRVERVQIVARYLAEALANI